MGDTVKIKIEKDQERVSGGKVRVMTNGLQAELAAGQEIEVPEAHVETLRNANIYFEVVGGDDRASNPSTAPLTDTATRDHPNVDPMLTDGSGDAPEVPELENGKPDGKPAIGGATQASQEYDRQLSQVNAEGQGQASIPDSMKGEQAQAKLAEEGQSDTASRGAGNETGGGEEAGSAQNDAADPAKTDEPAEPGPLDTSINELKDYLDTIEDPAEIDKLIAAEKGGKSRVGAMNALEARKAALTN